MKVGLLSDIHGNGHALKAVLEKAKSKNVEKILCCGDYVGYYYEPDTVIDLLDEWDWVGIGGNHEHMLRDLSNKKNEEMILNKYGSGLFHAKEKLSHDNIVRLIQLPDTKKLRISEYNVLLCHGSPWSTDAYIYPDTDKKFIDKYFNFEFDISVYGHTHYPALWERNERKIIGK